MQRALFSEIRGALFAVGLIIAGLIAGGFVPANDPILMILDNLRPHLAALLVGIAVLLLPFRATLRAVLLLAVGLSVFAALVLQLQPVSRPISTTSPDLELIAFNVLGSNSKNGQPIAAFLENSGADIVVLDESRPVVPHLDRLAGAYPFRAGCLEGTADGGRCGDVLVLSKLPLQEVTVTRLSPVSMHQAITAKVDIGGVKMNLVAVHLLRPYFADAQIGEFDGLKRIVSSLDGPVIVVGDFNSATWFRPFLETMKSTNLVRAQFEPGTWPVGLGDFGMPIDHVLLSRDLIFTSLSALVDDFGSNHRGLSAGIAVAK